jgi:hypothetical protein
MQCEIEAFHFLATQEICPTSLLTQAIRLHTSTGAPDQFCPFGPVLGSDWKHDEVYIYLGCQTSGIISPEKACVAKRQNMVLNQFEAVNLLAGEGHVLEIF